MKVELKQIIDQLSEACHLYKNHKVAALVDENNIIDGWTIVEVFEDGNIKPLEGIKFNSIKELIEAYV